MSLKDKRVHSSFVGLPPRPRSLCGLDQMTNCLVFDWYSILNIKYCSFKDGDYVRSCLAFVRFVIHATLVIHGKIHAVRYQCSYFLYAWFYFFDSTCLQYAWFEAHEWHHTDCWVFRCDVPSGNQLYYDHFPLSQYVGRTGDFTHAPDLKRLKEPKFIYKFRFRHFLKMTDSMKFGPEW